MFDSLQSRDLGILLLLIVNNKKTVIVATGSQHHGKIIGLNKETSNRKKENNTQFIIAPGKEIPKIARHTTENILRITKLSRFKTNAFDVRNRKVDFIFLRGDTKYNKANKNRKIQ